MSYKESLLAVVADGEGDKLLLPPSALESLSRQDAVSMGPMLFELTWTKPATRAGEQSESVSRTTHAGVLEFVADEGTVGLPRKVVLSLLGATAQQVPVGKTVEKKDPLHHRQADRPATDQGGSGSDADGGGGGGGGGEGGDQQGAAVRPAVEGLGHVVVRYVRLAKATFARVVPETVGLSQVSELRAMLEHNMRNHATLTVGDHLSVWRRGKEFSLKVRVIICARRTVGVHKHNGAFPGFLFFWHRVSPGMLFCDMGSLVAVDYNRLPFHGRVRAEIPFGIFPRSRERACPPACEHCLVKQPRDVFVFASRRLQPMGTAAGYIE